MDTNFTRTRPGEILAQMPLHPDEGVWFIGRIHTPWTRREDCPKRGDIDAGPECRIEIDARWAAALEGIAGKPRIQVLYWMHMARRDLLVQTPSHVGHPIGTFAVRSPNKATVQQARKPPLSSAVTSGAVWLPSTYAFRRNSEPTADPEGPRI